MSYSTAMALIAAIIFIGTAVIAAMGRERKGLDFRHSA